MEYSTFGLSLEIKINKKSTTKPFNHAQLQRLATEQIQESFRKNFNTESYGSKGWAKLKPWYLNWKRSHGFQEEILRKTGEMEQQITSGKATLTDNGKTLKIGYKIFMKGGQWKYIVPLTGANPGKKQSLLSKKMYGRKAVIKAKELGQTGGSGFIPQRRWDYMHKPNIDRIALELANLIADREFK
jgi:hypothetical protein